MDNQGGIQADESAGGFGPKKEVADGTEQPSVLEDLQGSAHAPEPIKLFPVGNAFEPKKG